MTKIQAWKNFKNYRDRFRAKKFYVTKQEFDKLYNETNGNLKEIKSWQQQKIWQGQNISKIREGQEVTNLEYIRAIRADGSFNIARFREEQMYQMSKETFKAASKARKILKGKGFSYKDRSKSTQELAELMEEDIYNKRREYENQGYASKQINLMISEFFFGS